MSLKGYKTVLREARDEVVIHKSRFIGHAAPVSSAEEALGFLARIREEHRDATHNCYAYIIGRNAGIMRYSDDGEPSGTAGMPIIEVMKAQGVVDCAVVVTRYFGGILLGTGGLVRAYTASAAAALAAAKVVTVRACVRLTVSVDYALYERAVQLLQGAGGRLDEPVFADRVTLTALLPAGAEEPLLPAFAQLSRGAAAPQITPPFYAPL